MKNFHPSFLSFKSTIIFVLVIMFLSFLFSGNSEASAVINSDYIFEEGTISKIKDGDTFEVIIGKDVHTCRIAAVDTPEKFKGKKLNKDVERTHIKKMIHQEAGLQATEYAEDYFWNRHSSEIWVHIIDKDIYGRDLCVISTKDIGPSIENSYNCHILLDGYAVFYKNGKNLKKYYREIFKQCDLREDGLYKTFPILMERLGE